MIQHPDSNLRNAIRGHEAFVKSAHMRRHSRSMKYYSLGLALVAVAAASVIGVILLLEQNRFFKVETSATLSYNPVVFSDKVYIPSISEVLRIIQADIVKKEAYESAGFPDNEHKGKYLKTALDISYDLPQNPSNLLKVSVKWDNMEEARRLTDSYINAAIGSYFRVRNNYLMEMQMRLLKKQQDKKAKLEDIEKHLSQLSQTIQDENLKAELETLKTRRLKQEEVVFNLRKHLEMTQVQYEGLKTITPDTTKRQKIKNPLQHSYVMELIKKKDDALEDFEIQRAIAKENDLNFKQAQIKFGFAEDFLKRKLDELNLSEQDILDLDSSCLDRMEKLESFKASMMMLNKHITAAQEQLTQTQTQISDIRKLLPQEERLNEEHRETLHQINDINQDIKNIDNHLLMTALELQSLDFINIHSISLFTSDNYLIIILTGIIITASLLSLLTLFTEIWRHHVPTKVK